MVGGIRHTAYGRLECNKEEGWRVIKRLGSIYRRRRSSRHALAVLKGTGKDAVWERHKEGRCKATWKREVKLPWRKAGLLKSFR